MDIEDQLDKLKSEVEEETGEDVEMTVSDEKSKENVKAKKAKKSIEKKEKKETPTIKLSTIVENLGIPDMDTKLARKILRKEVKGDAEGKSTWAWETPEEAEKIGQILINSFNASKAKAAEKAEKPKKEKKAKESVPEPVDEEEEEDEEEVVSQPVKSSKRKSSRKA